MRKLLIVIGAVVLVVVPVAAPARGATATITATLEAPRPTIVRTTVLVRGTVSPPTATSRLYIQREVNRRWIDVASAPVDALGSFSAPITPTTAGLYVLRVRSATGAAVSAKLYLAVTNPVTIYVGGVGPFVTRGDSVHMKGTVTPANGTARVFVQRQVGRRWIDVARGPVDPSNGSYDVAVKPSQLGGYTLRVRSADGSAWSIPIRFSVQPR